jgi:hypothetical protein
MEEQQASRESPLGQDGQQASRLGAVAVKNLRETVPVGNFYEAVSYLNTLLTCSEIAHLSNSSVRGVEDWCRKAKQDNPVRTRSTPREIPVLKTMALLEYMQTEFDAAEPERRGDFLRSYIINPDSHDAVSMLDLIRDDQIPLVIERARQVFEPK